MCETMLADEEMKYFDKAVVIKTNIVKSLLTNVFRGLVNFANI